jgi:hypothetical protein
LNIKDKKSRKKIILCVIPVLFVVKNLKNDDCPFPSYENPGLRVKCNKDLKSAKQNNETKVKLVKTKYFELFFFSFIFNK